MIPECSCKVDEGVEKLIKVIKALSVLSVVEGSKGPFESV